MLVGFSWLAVNVLFIAADEIAGPEKLEKMTTQKGSAMEPTIFHGQTVRVLHTNVFERFDIVAYLAPDRDNEWYIGRIVGLPREEIEIREGIVYIDGVILDEPHAHSPRAASAPGQIPADRYFILGDNRSNSRDSSVFGPVLIDNVAGKVTLGTP